MHGRDDLVAAERRHFTHAVDAVHLLHDRVQTLLRLARAGQKRAGFAQELLLRRGVRVRAGGAHLADGVRQPRRVAHDRGDIVLARHVEHGLSLDRRGLGVGLIENLAAGFQLRSCENAEFFEHFHGFLRRQCRNGGNHVRQIRQASARRLLLPFLAVAVAIEQHAAVVAHILRDQAVDVVLKIVALLQDVRRLAEGLGDDGADNGIGVCDALRGADHAELELVAREGKGRGAVAVGRVLVNDGQRGNAGVQPSARDAAGSRAVFDDLIDHVAELRAEEDGDDRRGRFVRAEALIVAGTGRGHPQNIRMAIHRLDDAGKHQKEL